MEQPTSTIDDPTVHDAVLALALHRYVVDRMGARERVRLRTAAHVAQLVALRGLHPTTDVRLLGFELIGSEIRPLEQELASLMESRVRAPGAGRALDWVCRVIIGRTAVYVETAVDAVRCMAQTPGGKAPKSPGSAGIHERDLPRRPAAAHE